MRLPRHRVKQSADVTDRPGPSAVVPALVAFHLRHVVGNQEAAEADIFQSTNGFDRVAVPIAQEALGEIVDPALHVSEMDVEDPVPAAEVPDRVQYTLTGFHGAHVTLGIIWLLSLLLLSFKKGIVTPQKDLDVDLAALYWHFVDVVWIVIFTVVYLFGVFPGY